VDHQSASEKVVPMRAGVKAYVFAALPALNVRHSNFVGSIDAGTGYITMLHGARVKMYRGYEEARRRSAGTGDGTLQQRAVQVSPPLLKNLILAQGLAPSFATALPRRHDCSNCLKYRATEGRNQLKKSGVAKTAHDFYVYKVVFAGD
jgi:hypothetical protein